MKKILLITSLLFLGATGARADIVHRISASTQLTVDAAASAATRIGSTYSVQGSNITAGTMGGLTAATATAAAGHTDGVYTVTTAGDAFSLTEAYTQGDAPVTLANGTGITYDPVTYNADGDVTNAAGSNNFGTIENLPTFGQTTTSAGGMAATLAGTIATDGAITLTAGGAGTTATGQVVSEVTVR
tara:strand:+ start:1175 stop:1735 length:561 start_codon:yes stop_codon:yes gene_type:complete